MGVLRNRSRWVDVIGWRVGLILLISLVAFAAGLFTLTKDARDQWNELASASRDNNGWNVAQTEVEFLRAMNAVTIAGSKENPDPELLSEVRLRFDIFYSRMVTIRDSSTLAPARNTEFSQNLIAGVFEGLNRLIPAIDGDDDNLWQELPRISETLESFRADVRDLSLNGSKNMTVEAFDRRDRVIIALKKLGILTVVLVSGLMVLVVALIVLIVRERRLLQEKNVISQRLGAIIDTAMEGVVVVDDQARIVEFNPAAEQIFGYVRNEVLGKKAIEFLLDDQQRDTFASALGALSPSSDDTSLRSGRFQIQALRKGGEAFPVEISLSETDSLDGKLQVTFLRDISERLEARRQLEEARDKAMAGEKAKTQMLLVMSHEMRTPLNGILGALELMQNTELSPIQKKYSQAIEASGHLLLRHVNTAMDISVAERNQLTVEQNEFDLKLAVGEIVSSMKADAEGRGNTILVSVHEGLTKVVGDVGRVQQILGNLLANAIQHTENGKIKVEVGRVGAGDTVEFRVTDTGVGIAPSDIERIFEDFVRLDSSFSRGSDGTGLGLGIVRRLVEVMGGDIGVESQLADGSLFWVTLPLPAVVEEAPAAPDAPIQQEFEQFGQNVLVVEDNMINRLVIKDMLVKLGCQVTEAVNGEVGVNEAQSQKFDLILMDISMPVMDGVTATQLIKKSGKNAETPVFAVTAHAQPEEIAAFEQAGIDETIIKPLTIAKLKSTLAAISSSA